ncbi:YqaE/Pmp3 family membrane protein [Sphingomonas sp. HITSZ_GF]|uniref:YqaE/Pmp3 family membrane protein n=1 Tax=Sphingomonas sp. HITSZ_GF TaxID=3037247 RepID=UPI00240E8913|nr:YqaE/Pmp3 family membrane protein [Sphingomonas sp. HITSZ_GF]MDG2534599.1 YqaE/Pmp3 family membrane protein [Sphingomonas sp. HITSZ_GF]
MAARPGPIVAAALLPPLGTYLARGVGRDFWITTGLTVLGFLPGVGFALWRVLGNSRVKPAESAAA